jgi:hypothetical protein
MLCVAKYNGLQHLRRGQNATDLTSVPHVWVFMKTQHVLVNSCAICCRTIDMSSIEGNFTIPEGASVTIVCSASRNFLHLHTASRPPVISEGAELAMHTCDVTTFKSPAAALDPSAEAVDMFGVEIGAVARMLDCTLLHNWNVRPHCLPQHRTQKILACTLVIAVARITVAAGGHFSPRSTLPHFTTCQLHALWALEVSYNAFT